MDVSLIHFLEGSKTLSSIERLEAARLSSFYIHQRHVEKGKLTLPTLCARFPANRTAGFFQQTDLEDGKHPQSGLEVVLRCPQRF